MKNEEKKSKEEKEIKKYNEENSIEEDSDPEGSQSEPKNPDDVFTFNMKVQCSPDVSMMSEEILEKVNSAVKKAAMKELSNQIETVYKPWNASFKNEEQKEIQIGNENYDAYKSNLENSCYSDCNFFQTQKSHKTRHYFYKQAVVKLKLDHLAESDETDLHTLTKERGLKIHFNFLYLHKFRTL